eukprot:SAG31_NODE_25817_length_453_cov_1.039548_1_plen_27_part_10
MRGADVVLASVVYPYQSLTTRDEVRIV